MKNNVGLGLPEYRFNNTTKALIIGAGLAGCAIARALAKRGYRSTLFDQGSSAATAASALPRAVVRPAISGDKLFSNYFDRAFELCCRSLDESQFRQCGALELGRRGPDNNESTDSFNQYHSDHQIEHVTRQQASSLAGTELNSGALYIAKAGLVVPRSLCNLWLNDPLIEIKSNRCVFDIQKTAYGWQLIAENKDVLEESPLVIVANAGAATQFSMIAGIPLQQAAGQIDHFSYKREPLNCIINGRGYLAPTSSGVWCGATHHKEDRTTEVTDADSRANKITAMTIAPKLDTTSLPAASFREIRTFTPDRLPVVGAVPDEHHYRTNYKDLKHGKRPDHFAPPQFHHGLYLAAGLGSRGATQALLTGEIIADLISGDHQYEPGFYQSLHPARFLVRSLKRG